MSSPYGLELVPNCIACGLRSDCFFCSLPLSSRRALEKIKVSNLLPAGSTLFVAGETPTGVHLICQGRVGLLMCTARGRTIVLKVAGPGEALGLHSCISRTAHEHSAKTLQPCQVAFVPAGEFMRLLRSRRDIRWRTAQALGCACYSARELVRNVGFRHTAAERLARLLLDLASSTRSDGSLAQPIEVPLNRQQIADAMGMSRGTMQRILAAYRDAQIATVQGNTLIVRDPKVLHRIAEHGDERNGNRSFTQQARGSWRRLRPLRGDGEIP